MPKHLSAAAMGVALALLLPSLDAGEAIFDSHLHFSGSAAAELDPDAALATLTENDVSAGIVSSWPNDGTVALYEAAPDRIVPFLSIYEEPADKNRWPEDESVIPRVQAALERGIYQGIGELHIFAPHRRSPVFRQLVEIAAERDLWLQIHGDPAAIDAAFEYAPEVKIQWAHGGAYPYPDLLWDYLDRYPNLYVDLSMRNARVAPEGALAPAWRDLFLDFPDRFMVGMDTFSVRRWERYGELAAETRAWLAQLPDDIARMIARENGQRLFLDADAAD